MRAAGEKARSIEIRAAPMAVMALIVFYSSRGTIPGKALRAL
jgi:hypothetical protein